MAAQEGKARAERQKRENGATARDGKKSPVRPEATAEEGGWCWTNELMDDFRIEMEKLVILCGSQITFPSHLYSPDLSAETS